MSEDKEIDLNKRSTKDLLFYLINKVDDLSKTIEKNDKSHNYKIEALEIRIRQAENTLEREKGVRIALPVFAALVSIIAVVISLIKFLA